MEEDECAVQGHASSSAVSKCQSHCSASPLAGSGSPFRGKVRTHDGIQLSLIILPKNIKCFLVNYAL